VSASVLYMSMSLDGYIAGPNDEPGNPGGDDFMRLHHWFVTPNGEFFRPSGPAGELIDEINATGAVLAGRRTVEQVDHWGGDHHGVPIFVLSHRPPGPSVANYPLVTYVTDGIASAMARAKAAAGDRDVLVHGAYTAQRALEAGVLDEMEATGAVVTGRRTAELMDHWGGDIRGGIPIFVPSHRPPGPAARWGYPLVTYVTDGIESAMAQAKAAAGDRNVYVQGAYTAQRALEAGVLDEIQIHQIPMLLGSGRRLFGELASSIELDVVRVIDTPDATHIRYRVRR